MRFLITSDPGLEEIAAEEICDELSGADVKIRPCGLPGQIMVQTSASERLFDLKTIHHVVEIRGELEIESPDRVAGALSEVEFPELRDADSFRVTSKLSGDHRCDKLEIQRAAGAVLHERHRTPVDLENYELNIRVDLYGDRLVIGIQRTRDSLGNRIKRTKPLRSALKPTIAAAMLRIAGAHQGGGRLIDPMCGSGTIPVEAARINPRLEQCAADWDRDTTEVARDTLSVHGLEIPVEIADARALGEAYPSRFDFIVTNPPYGLRQAKRTGITRLYRALLSSFGAAIKDSGTIVLIVVKYRAFLAALDGSGLEIVDERVVDLGGLEARIYRICLKDRGQTPCIEDRGQTPCIGG
jgi:putative N6-adenine-specific DNA methylase/tRNA (guanine6-N2)-methyltransferase